jgi:hypothetical protein
MEGWAGTRDDVAEFMFMLALFFSSLGSSLPSMYGFLRWACVLPEATGSRFLKMLGRILPAPGIYFHQEI